MISLTKKYNELLRQVEFENKEMAIVADYIAFLSLMMVRKANSGHPGMPLGCARLYALLRRFFVNNSPKINANVALQDRLVLSAGHGSAILYAGGYFFDETFELEDLANFRTLDSNTPGHPELDVKRGIYTTTGPLGQGFANAVGMALEMRMLRDRAKNAGMHEVKTEGSVEKNFFDSNVFTIFGDGCMMEGITTEAASLASSLGLGNFVALYDDNNITIDGEVSIACSEDVETKFKAIGFVTARVDGNDFVAMAKALANLMQQSSSKPKLLIVKTVIGRGLPAEGTSKVHGAPANADHIAVWLAKSELQPCFEKQELNLTAINSQLESGTFLSLAKLCEVFPKVRVLKNNLVAQRVNWAKEVLEPFQLALQHKNGENFNDAYMQEYVVSASLEKELLQYRLEKSTAATRDISEEILLLVATHQENLVGGSADLVASTKAHVKGAAAVLPTDYSGRNISYGIREHAMGAVGNGLALAGNFIPFSSTFLVFLDYMRPTVRLAALMGIHHAFIFTHDSYCVGEDGPTHQPIEHVSSLRLMPGLDVYRPATDREVALCYLNFLKNKKPAAFILSRQAMNENAIAQGTSISDEKLQKNVQLGGYIFYETSNEAMPHLILVSSGFEVGVAHEVALAFEKQGKNVRVVSVPCLEKFVENSNFKSVCGISSNTPCVFIEPYSLGPYGHLVHENFMVKSIETFGKSAKQQKLERYFGFDKENLIKEISDKFFK